MKGELLIALIKWGFRFVISDCFLLFLSIECNVDFRDDDSFSGWHNLLKTARIQELKLRESSSIDNFLESFRRLRLSWAAKVPRVFSNKFSEIVCCRVVSSSFSNSFWAVENVFESFLNFMEALSSKFAELLTMNFQNYVAIWKITVWRFYISK